MTVGYLDRALGYARRVVAGAESAGKWERRACERFLRDLERTAAVDQAAAPLIEAADQALAAAQAAELAIAAGTGDAATAERLRAAADQARAALAADEAVVAWPYVLDEARGSRACLFIELLPHIKGEWAKPVYVDGGLRYARIALEDWQIFVELQLFGWVHRTTRLRRFRRSYEEVARKNAKSTRVAARELYLLAADGEPGAHVYSAATTGDQAREVFDVARNMGLRETEFRARFGVNIGKHDIVIAETASSFRPLNAEGSTLDGLNVHAACIDELHAHKTRAVWDVIDSATGARSQPLVSAITTAGSDRAGICYELRDYVRKILDGVLVDETWFGIIYCPDDEDIKAGRWDDPAVWRKANPNLGVSVKLDDMQAAAKRAMAQPSALNAFLTKRLNVWVSSDSAWLDMRAWDACADPTLSIEDFRGEEMVAGLDLASKVDIAAKIKLFRREIDDKEHFYAFLSAYLPQRAIDIGTNSQYAGWARQGLLTVTDGEVTDYGVIEDEIRDDMAAHQVLEVAFDPFQATQLSGNLLDDGVPMVEMRPTVLNFSEPMKLLEALVLEGRLHHDGNPLLAWMVSNVVCHTDAKDNIYPRKERAENKIDGVVALIMALGRFVATPARAVAVGIEVL